MSDQSLESAVQSSDRLLGPDVSVGVIKLISENLYSDDSSPIVEYIKNGWDADATLVEVVLNRDSITISDDGRGMDYHILGKDFLVLGKDPELRRGRTKGGRPCMGRWGIGSYAAYRLGDGFIVTTKREGKQFEYDLNFRELEANEKKGKKFYESRKAPKETQVDPKEHGTRIEIYGLKEHCTRRISQLIELLSKRIGKEMPINKDFLSRLNGKKVSHYMDQFLQDAKMTEMKFTVQDDDGKDHNVTGWFKVTEKALKSDDSGIYPVVNAQVLSKIAGHMYNPDNIHGFAPLKNRIYGEFEASFLADLLTSSRDRYSDEYHPLITQIYDRIHEYLKGTVKEAETEKKRKSDQQLDQILDMVTANVGFAFDKMRGSSSVGEDPKGTRIFHGRRKPWEIPEEEKQFGSHPRGHIIGQDQRLGQKYIDIGGHRFFIHPYEGGKDGSCVELNPDGQELLINKQFPMFVRTKSISTDSLEIFVTCNIIKELSWYLAVDLDGNGPEEAARFYNSALGILGKVPIQKFENE